MSSRFHWPMQGPHALANTVAPIASRSASRPSRSIVARTRSEPGVTSSGVFTPTPAWEAWRAIDAVRAISSYDELLHEPISAELIFSGQTFSMACAPTSDIVSAEPGEGGE